MKVGVYFVTRSSVMMAEAVHSLADLANQALLAYGLMSSKRAPDVMHPYGYTKERFVWALISATGIFCLGSGVTIMHGIQCLLSPEPVENVFWAGVVIVVSAVLEGASFLVALRAVRAGAKEENMTLREYLWKGHDPTAVAVLMEDGAAVTGLGIAAASMAAVHLTGNHIYDAVGSLAVGGLLGVVAVVLIGRNRESLLGRSMGEADVRKVIHFLRNDSVVDAVWDCKSEVIGPGAYRFKAEIDFNGVVIVQHYLNRVGRGRLFSDVRTAVQDGNDGALDQVFANYGEELMTALGREVDRLEEGIKRLVPEIRHVDIEAHNPSGPDPREKVYVGLGYRDSR